MSFARTLVLLPALLAALPIPAPALAEPLEACFVTWPPYEQTIDGKPAGLTVDIMAEAARRAGYQIRFTERPWRRCLADVADGAADLFLDGSDHPEYLRGRNPTAAFVNAFFVRTDDPLRRYDGVAALEGRSIGLVRTYTYPAEIRDLPGLQRNLAPETDEQQATMLAAGRFDLLLGDLVNIRALAAADHLAIRSLSPAFSVTPLYPHFGQGAALPMHRIDEALGAMQADGTIDRIYRARIGTGLGDLLAGRLQPARSEMEP
ncbi:MAG TPA: transporter substrate-binding domain-containing protein [Aliidongia sp.]|nr:transporter substrate-binding domain-containing protein [Aliidongia sp.]